MLEEKIQEFKIQGEAYLTIRVRPAAAHTGSRSRLADGSYKIDIAAPAEKNKANQELIRFLSEIFQVRRDQVRILSGAGEKVKLVKVSGDK